LIKYSCSNKGCKRDPGTNAYCAPCFDVYTEIGLFPEKHKEEDVVNNPKHYTAHPSGIECIEVTEHMGFNLGNAVKYLWRSDLKDNAIQDLNKAKWYIEREIDKRTKETK